MRKGDKMKNIAMARLLVAGMALTLAATAGAMPTKQELAGAQQLVKDLTEKYIRALTEKKMTAVEAAAAHLELADKAESEAGKYLFLQGAFRLYARGGDYDSAATVLQRMRTEISNLPPEVVVELVNNDMSRVASEKAPKVLAIYRDARRIIKYRKLLPSLEREVKSKPKDTQPRRRLAECYANLGEWPKALPLFASLGNAAAKYELDTASAKDFDALKAADFWWDYKAVDTDTFKVHAVSLYRAAIKKGVATGLRREVALKRIAEADSIFDPSMQQEQAPDGPWVFPKKFNTPLERSLDLGNGVQMPFCAIPAGSFMMMDHKVTITRPYWISKTPITINQVIEEGGHDHVDKFKEIVNAFKDRTLLFSGDPTATVKSLNKKYKSDLPPGYVFRLPTEGELIYAFTACKDDDEYKGCPSDDALKATGEACLSRGWATRDKNGQISVPSPYNCAIFANLPNANALGFIPWHDAWAFGGKYPFAVLDKMYEEITKMPSRNREDIKKAFCYADEEVDPLRDGTRPLYVGANDIRNRRSARANRSWGVACVVIGPDIESEKKRDAKK